MVYEVIKFSIETELDFANRLNEDGRKRQKSR